MDIQVDPELFRRVEEVVAECTGGAGRLEVLQLRVPGAPRGAGASGSTGGAGGASGSCDANAATIYREAQWLSKTAFAIPPEQILRLFGDNPLPVASEEVGEVLKRQAPLLAAILLLLQGLLRPILQAMRLCAAQRCRLARDDRRHLEGEALRAEERALARQQPQHAAAHDAGAAHGHAQNAHAAYLAGTRHYEDEHDKAPTEQETPA
jgi:hypothetical protein